MGVSLNGMWYAPISQFDTSVEICPQSVAGITQVAKMAAIAIPLKHIVGEDHVDCYKYCVITNWWKEREEDGRYSLPGLNRNLHQL